MSDSTPVRTSKEIAQFFDITEENTNKIEYDSINDRNLEFNPKESAPTYEDFKVELAEDADVLMQESAKKYDSNATKSLHKTPMTKSGMKKSRVELIYGPSPLKVKESPKVSILSKSVLDKSPLASKPNDQKKVFTAKKSKAKLFNGLGNSAKANKKTHRALKSEMVGDYMNFEQKLNSPENTKAIKSDLVREIEENKIDIKAKKQRLDDLEVEI